jgi:hypothetical protein
MSEEEDKPELHSVAELAATLLSGGINGEPYALSETAEARLDRALDALHGSIELKHACADLIRLGAWLDREAASPEAAEALLRVLERAVPALDAVLAEHDPESLTETKARFDRFRDEEGRKAPKVGDEAPRGSVKLGTLDYPKRG